MPNLPVDAAGLPDFERRLGVRLPGHYVASMLDPGVRKVLSHRTVGALHPAWEMRHFAELTESLRERQPEFPRDGVAVSCGIDPATEQFQLERGYLRFLMPERKDPTRLGDALYSWDLAKRRKARDGTLQQFVAGFLHTASAPLLASAGLERPPDPYPPEPTRTRPVYADLIAILGLRGDAARARLAALEGHWVPCARLQLEGNWLSVCDKVQVPTADVGVRLPPGSYDAQVQLAPSRLGDWAIVSKLRMLRAGAEASQHRHAHDVDVDLAAVAIHDRQSLFRKVSTWDRDAVCDEMMELDGTPCIVVIRKGLEALIVPSGDGDGSYPVFVLLDGESAVGIEVEFSPRA